MRIRTHMNFCKECRDAFELSNSLDYCERCRISLGVPPGDNLDENENSTLYFFDEMPAENPWKTVLIFR